jgi:hypothetical protein
MARIKEVIELIRQCYAQAKDVATRATMKDSPTVGHADAQKTDGTRGIEIIRAVFPNEN